MKLSFQYNISILNKILLILLFSSSIFAQTSDTLIARRHLKQALILTDSAQYDSALLLNQQAIPVFENQAKQDILALSDLYNNRGDCLQEKGNYQEALSYFGKSLECLINGEQSKNETVTKKRVAKTYNHLGVLYMTVGDYAQAFNYHQQALNLRLNLWGEQHEKVADSYNNMANCFIQVEDYDQALAAHQLALSIRLNVLGNQHLDVASSYNNIGSCWLQKGVANKALPFYKKALRIRQKALGSKHTKIAQSLLNMGNTFQALGDIEAAIDFYQKALNIEKDIYGEQHIQLAGTYNNIGTSFSKKGDYLQALTFYKKALQIQLQTYGNQHPEVADTYTNMGNAYVEKGDYKLAENYYRQSMSMRQHIFGFYHQKVALSLDNLGLCYRYMGEFQKAAEHHVQALNIQKQLSGESHFYVGGIYSNLANCFLIKKAYPEALENYEKAHTIFENALGENHPYLVSNYGNLGVCYLKTKQYDKALENFQKALSILQQNTDYQHHTIAKYYKNIGQVYQQQGQLDLALDFYKKGLTSLGVYKKEHSHPSIELLDLLTAQANTRFILYQKKSNPEQLSGIALDYEKNLRLMDTLRQTFQEQESKQILAQNNYRIFEGAMAVYFEQWRQSGDFAFLEKAFALSEKSKSIILLEALQKSNADRFAGIPEHLLDKEYDLRVNLAYLEKKRDTRTKHHSNSSIDSLENKIFDTRQAYQNLIRQFEQNYPDYYQLKYDSRTTSMASIQEQLLTEDQAMLHYFTGDNSIYVFLITSDVIDAFEIKNDFPMESWVKQLRDGIFNYPFASSSKVASFRQDYISSAYQLYQKVILPIVQKHDLPERLVVVPDGALGFLPFDALLKELPKKATRFKTHHYLLEDFAISYSFSATLLARTKEKKETYPQQRVLALAPSFKNNSLNLSELKYNQSEAEHILTLLDGDLLAHQSATLERFLQKASDYYILHLATHGKTNLKASEYSYLAFTEISDSLDNELLYVKDLYHMRLKAAMVVLSACETGIGEYQRGEGIVSLARGFSYAGASSIITTLWSINDKKTAQLMALFYENIKAGQPKDQALQFAKRDFIVAQNGHDEGHPYFWSGYVAIGEMEALNFGWTWWMWACRGLLGLLLLALLRTFYKKIKS